MKFIFVICFLLGSVFAAQAQTNNVIQESHTYVEQSYPDHPPIIQREGQDHDHDTAKSKIRYFVWGIDCFIAIVAILYLSMQHRKSKVRARKYKKLL